MEPRVRKAYYDTTDGQVHYRYVAAATKKMYTLPIFFFHMCPTSSLYFEDLMLRCSDQGYDCYAPDMPGFGGSYNPKSQPSGIGYYVEAFMLLADYAGIPKFHVLGHHSGASIATEMAATHPKRVSSLCICGPALLTSDEQAAVAPMELVMYNAPVPDGSHLLETWKSVDSQGTRWELTELHNEVLLAARSYEGRIQIYTCVFSQPAIEMLKKVTCPILGMCSEKDMLYSYLPRVKETKPDASVAIVEGGNWEVLKDAEGVCKELTGFLANIQ